jgi:hypothetical protein
VATVAKTSRRRTGSSGDGLPLSPFRLLWLAASAPVRWIRFERRLAARVAGRG